MRFAQGLFFFWGVFTPHPVGVFAVGVHVQN
ncbi:MAG: hypothetical protein RLZZ612_1362, partial [Pseudomonadota bacterium]